MKKPLVIGVLGGMGTYATLNLFQQYARMFPAVKEWERPRLLIDNNCTMPSRVRAILYNEKYDELVDQMTGSLWNLQQAGANRILLACNTSHLFLPRIYQRKPELKNSVVNILEACRDQLLRDAVHSVYVLATEGTLVSGVYQNLLKDAGIECNTPSEEDFSLLRECIEAVKQNRYTAEAAEAFEKLMKAAGNACVLGCTELPVLFDRLYPNGYPGSTRIYDPLLIALGKIHEDYENWENLPENGETL